LGGVAAWTAAESAAAPVKATVFWSCAIPEKVILIIYASLR
jgi:hypothetical protein